MRCLALAWQLAQLCRAHVPAQPVQHVIQADGTVTSTDLPKGKHSARSGKLVRSLKEPVFAEEVVFTNTSLETESDSALETESDSAFKLAVYAAHEQGVMKYGWSGWDSCEEFSGNNGDDKKTKFYCAKAKTVKITFMGQSRGVFEIKTDGKKSVKELFLGSTMPVGDLAHWRSAVHCWQLHCNRFGFNAQGSSACRFGIITNNENDCNTCDHNAGIGCTFLQTGSKAGCCWHNCPHRPFHTKVEVIPVTCDEDVCDKGQLLKEEPPDFCEGQKCTPDECCVDTTTTTAKGFAERWHLPLALLALTAC